MNARLRPRPDAPPVRPPADLPPLEQPLLPSAMQDPQFRARLKQEAHRMRSEAIRDIFPALARWLRRDRG
jgi:hypothetical protein